MMHIKTLMKIVISAIALLALAACASTANRTGPDGKAVTDGPRNAPERVLIPGSRIPRDAETVDSQAAHMIITFTNVVSREEIQSTGKTKVGEALRQLDPSVR